METTSLQLHHQAPAGMESHQQQLRHPYSPPSAESFVSTDPSPAPNIGNGEMNVTSPAVVESGNPPPSSTSHPHPNHPPPPTTSDARPAQKHGEIRPPSAIPLLRTSGIPRPSTATPTPARISQSLIDDDDPRRMRYMKSVSHDASPHQQQPPHRSGIVGVGGTASPSRLLSPSQSSYENFSTQRSDPCGRGDQSSSGGSWLYRPNRSRAGARATATGRPERAVSECEWVDLSLSRQMEYLRLSQTGCVSILLYHQQAEAARRI